MFRVVALVFVALISAVITSACTAPPQTAEGSPTEVVPEQPEATMESDTEEETSPSPTPVPTDTPAPTPTSTPAPLQPAFEIQGDEPVVAHGPEDAWDGRYMDPGAVLFHDGLFHMFHNGFTAWPGRVGIAYSTSPDGANWTRVQEEPVFTGEDVEYAGLTLLASSALVEEDGTWVLYFYTWDSTAPSGPSKIGRATAPAPTGPWAADDSPILTAGGEEEWDSYTVSAPSVVKSGDDYVMYYMGGGRSRNTYRVGMATSTDGIEWSKYNDPATTEAPYAESDPILQTSDEEDAWDSFLVHHPQVVLTPDGWVMLYRATNLRQHIGYGLAASEDGIAWTRYPENPILTPADVMGAGGMWFTELLYQNDTYFLFVEVGRGGGTDIFLATHAGTLRP